MELFLLLMIAVFTFGTCLHMEKLRRDLARLAEQMEDHVESLRQDLSDVGHDVLE